MNVNFIPIAIVTLWLRRLKIFAFDTRITVVSLLILVIALILYVISFLNFYSPRSTLPYAQWIIDKSTEPTNSKELVQYLSLLCTSMENSNIYYKALVSLEINHNLLLPTIPSPTCSKAMCSVNGESHNNLRGISLILEEMGEAPEVKGLPRDVFVSSEDVTQNTIPTLVTEGWISNEMNTGMIMINMLARDSLLSSTSYTSTTLIYEIGSNTEIVQYSLREFSLDLNPSQKSFDIISSILIAIFCLVYLLKYLIKLNFSFSQTFLFYGLVFLGVLLLAFTLLIMKFNIVKKVSDENRAPTFTDIKNLKFVYSLFGISFYFLSLFFAVEILKMLTFVKRMKEIRSAVFVLYRTAIPLVKILIFMCIVILARSIALLGFSGMMITQTYSDLILFYTGISFPPSSQFMIAIEANHTLFNWICNMIIVCVVYVSIHNAHHYE